MIETLQSLIFEVASDTLYSTSVVYCVDALCDEVLVEDTRALSKAVLSEMRIQAAKDAEEYDFLLLQGKQYLLTINN